MTNIVVWGILRDPGLIGGALASLGKYLTPEYYFFGITGGRFMGARYVDAMVFGGVVKICGIAA